MFGEALIQKAIFVLAPSPEARRGRILVLSFIIFIAAATFYDTMLWALDRPGYILHATTVQASRSQVRPDAAYAVHTMGVPGVVSGIDLAFDLGEGLWSPGVNASLTGDVEIGTGIVVPTHNFSATEKYPGPRIWLDRDGFSVALDYIPSGADCTEVFDGRVVEFGCDYELYGTGRGGEYVRSVFAYPTVFWDTEDSASDWHIGLERGSNPWRELGKESETLVMREVFTVTKGRMRHVFLLSAFKATMTTTRDAELKDAEIEDLVRRTWGEDPGVNVTIGKVMATIKEKKEEDRGLNLGWVTGEEDGRTLHQRRYLLTKVIERNTNQTTGVGSRWFQVQTASLKLLRSETLPNDTPSFETCDGYYVSHANGGKARYSTCTSDPRSAVQPARYLGQIDVSAIYILADTLGKTSANYSARVLNETAWQWLKANSDDIDKYVIARGYLLGVNPTAVTIKVHRNIPAVSVVQLLLVLLPLVLAGASWLLVFFRVPAYYQASLFSIIVSTSQDAGGEPGYMTNPPDIQVVSDEKQVMLRTPTGLFFHDVEGGSPGGSSSGGRGQFGGSQFGARGDVVGGAAAGVMMIGVGAQVLKVAE